MNESPVKSPAFPLLQFLLRSKWFRVLVVVLVAVPLAVLLGVVKLWRTSPAGFTPKIKVSAVNLVQAWALQRSATAAAAKGQLDRALYSWRLAVANNPANPRLNRGLLECVLQSPNRREHAGLAVQQTLWLLKLTHTNVTDLELATRVLQEFELHPLVADLLKPVEDRLTPVLAPAYLRSLFLSGRMEDFARCLRVPALEAPAGRGLALYRAAYEAGWGTPAQKPGAWTTLETAQQRPDDRLLACQLSMMAGFHAGEVARFERAFNLATNLHTDRLVDHVNRWRLYAGATNLAKAKQLALAFSGSPSNGMETVVLARTYRQLELRDQALQVLKSGLPRFGGASELWLLYAECLTQDRQWDGLLGLANQMRQDRRVARELAGRSYYLEGFAQAARQHRAQAEAAFRRVPEFELPAPPTLVGMSQTMLELGFAEPAKRLLLKCQDHFKQAPEYWHLLYYSAVGSKDEPLLLSAAREMYSLAATNWQAQYAYAAALLTLRIQPEEALRLTRAVLQQQPEHPGARINHSLALLQNRLAQEARLLLQEIDVSRLDAAQSNALNQAEFELCYALRDYEQARQISTRIDRNALFASEAKWFDEALQQIQAQLKAAVPGPRSAEPNLQVQAKSRGR